MALSEGWCPSRGHYFRVWLNHVSPNCTAKVLFSSLEKKCRVQGVQKSHKNPYQAIAFFESLTDAAVAKSYSGSISIDGWCIEIDLWWWELSVWNSLEQDQLECAQRLANAERRNCELHTMLLLKTEEAVERTTALAAADMATTKLAEERECLLKELLQEKEARKKAQVALAQLEQHTSTLSRIFTEEDEVGAEPSAPQIAVNAATNWVEAEGTPAQQLPSASSSQPESATGSAAGAVWFNISNEAEVVEAEAEASEVLLSREETTFQQDVAEEPQEMEAPRSTTASEVPDTGVESPRPMVEEAVQPGMDAASSSAHASPASPESGQRFKEVPAGLEVQEPRSEGAEASYLSAPLENRAGEESPRPPGSEENEPTMLPIDEEEQAELQSEDEAAKLQGAESVRSGSTGSSSSSSSRSSCQVGSPPQDEGCLNWTATARLVACLWHLFTSQVERCAPEASKADTSPRAEAPATVRSGCGASSSPLRFPASAPTTPSHTRSWRLRAYQPHAKDRLLYAEGKLRRVGKALRCHLSDPNTSEMLVDPVMTPSGTTYDSTSIMKWISRSQTDPRTRLPLTPQMLRPNRQARELLSLFRLHFPELQEMTPADHQECQTEVHGLGRELFIAITSWQESRALDIVSGGVGDEILNEQFENNGRKGSLLFWAMSFGLPKVAVAIIRHNNFQILLFPTSLGLSNLHYAAALGYRDVCEELLKRLPLPMALSLTQKSVKLQVRDRVHLLPANSTAMAIARQMGHYDIWWHFSRTIFSTEPLVLM